MIKLINVSYMTEDKVEILHNVNLTIDDSKFVVITGPNGGGKSTLAKVITGIIKPTSGKIIFNDIDITLSLIHILLIMFIICCVILINWKTREVLKIRTSLVLYQFYYSSVYGSKEIFSFNLVKNLANISIMESTSFIDNTSTGECM